MVSSVVGCLRAKCLRHFGTKHTHKNYALASYLRLVFQSTVAPTEKCVKNVYGRRRCELEKLDDNFVCLLKEFRQIIQMWLRRFVLSRLALSFSHLCKRKTLREWLHRNGFQWNCHWQLQHITKLPTTQRNQPFKCWQFMVMGDRMGHRTKWDGKCHFVGSANFVREMRHHNLDKMMSSQRTNERANGKSWFHPKTLSQIVEMAKWHAWWCWTIILSTADGNAITDEH